MRYLEDLEPGDRFESDSFNVTEEAIIEFGKQFDPQTFHIDPVLARQTIFNGLTASGWHTAAITMRLFIQTLQLAEGAVGLGVDELRWPAPVRPGDTLRVTTEIVNSRPSKSKVGYGIIQLRNVTTNQRGEVVQTMSANALVPLRR